MADNSSFDARVERFLKGLMSPEEENAFKSELHSDSDKLHRAQTIALAIKQMQHAEKNADADFISDVSGMSEADIERLANNPYEDFDNQVDRFLRNQMTVEEESAFKSLLNSSKELQERAHAIALAIEKMREEGRQKDLQIIEAIKDTDINALPGPSQPISTAASRKGEDAIRGAKTPTHKMVINWRRIMSIAASVLLVLGFGGTLFVRQGQINDLNAAVEKYHAFGISRGVPRSPVDSLLIALEKCGSEETVQQLISEKDNHDEESAIIDWCIAVYYIKQKDYNKAKRYLDEIVAEHEDEPLAKSAQEILQKIDGIWFK